MPEVKVKTICFQPVNESIYIKSRCLQLQSRFIELGFERGIPALVANIFPQYRNEQSLARLRQALNGRTVDADIVQALERVLDVLDYEDDPATTLKKLSRKDDVA